MAVLEDGKPVSKHASTLMEFAACLLQHQKFADFKDPDRCNPYSLDAFYTVCPFMSFTVHRFQKCLTRIKFGLKGAAFLKFRTSGDAILGANWAAQYLIKSKQPSSFSELQ
jgi:hypothetical protein